MTHKPTPGLTTLQREVLQFENRWWRGAGAKQRAIRDELGLTEARYYQELAQLLDNPAASQEQPALMQRLRQARDERRRARTADLP
ncbi:MAG TPA: DUF3263 domain-containing protein [Candidatus Stackebrandtia faecavium]|nr:DUF3263 domain-containing protein [Candidatus Stackebrandtia faecavium]